jgi:hypothetical protein
MRMARIVTAAVLGLASGSFLVGCGPGLGERPALNAAEPPVIPVGLDAFRMWDRWAYLRIGQRTYMTSTYDRCGANETADASCFLYQLAEDRSISLDIMGKGVLAFVRTNHWHGSPWHYIVDGRDHVVKESSTADPDHPVENSVFIPQEQFPHPLTWTWSITKGADLMWVPIPFEQSFTMAYGRTHYGTGYYIYHKFLPDAPNLSRPIKSWNMDVPPADVLDLINRSGTDLATAASASHTDSGAGDASPGSHSVLYDLLADHFSLAHIDCGPCDVTPGNDCLLGDIMTARPRMVRAIKLSVKEDQAKALGEAVMSIRWDGREQPSVKAPVKLLFGTGSMYNRDKREYLVKAFPVNVRFAEGQVHLSMYFPMPFQRTARFELAAAPGMPISGLRSSIDSIPYEDPANWVGYFHATYVDHGEPKPGRELVFLDTTKVEGGGDWCGHFVGTSFIFSERAVLHTLEGDPRFYFDDSNTPQAQGTGTEEWGGGGDYWGGRNMTIPFAGHPVGCRKKEEAKDPEDLIQSAYRFLLSDLMPFGKNARITFEHGGDNNVPERYRSVTFWYGINQPCLILSDTFEVGDDADEHRHHYESPQASPVQTLSSRYEWGVDHLGEKEIFPETTDTGRFTKGVSTFTLKLDPRNIGAMLRRKMDYSFPNQCAKVFVSDDKPHSPWREVGTWYTAGSNTAVFSNPKAETGAAEHIVRTSNRRWREDEFLLPRSATQGRSAIRVKVEFTPRSIPLFPGHPVADQAWSEYQYKAYSYVMPRVAEN